ncbi:MAG: folate-binding protein YgfZ [Xanthobacter sp.]
MPAIHLADRVLMRAAGPQAGHFLHGVVTCNVVDLAQGQARYGAMLQPQGKIIADFLLYREAEESFLLDAPADVAESLLKRLTLLRLRAQLTLERPDDLAVAALLDTQAMPEGAMAYADPRLDALGPRLVMPRATAEALRQDTALYEAHRIRLGIPKGGVDFAYGDAFPHEVDMDQLGGVDFDKGCYVGQEVVSRMEHRSTPRNRIVQALFPQEAIAGGEILAGEKVAGRITSAAGRQAIASVRLDRTGDAQAKGVPLLVDGVEIELQRPAWAHFDMTWTRKESPLDTVLKAGG